MENCFFTKYFSLSKFPSLSKVDCYKEKSKNSLKDFSSFLFDFSLFSIHSEYTVAKKSQ